MRPSEIERLAQTIERLGIALPTMMLLESCKPLHRLAEHAFTLFPTPPEFLNHPFANIVRDRQSAELLIARLERGAAA